MPSAVGVICVPVLATIGRRPWPVHRVMPLGTVLGPNIGGFILEHWSWRDMFFINLPWHCVAARRGAAAAPGRASGRTATSTSRADTSIPARSCCCSPTMTADGRRSGLWGSPLLWGARAPPASLSSWSVPAPHQARAGPDHGLRPGGALTTLPERRISTTFFGAALFGFTLHSRATQSCSSA